MQFLLHAAVWSCSLTHFVYSLPLYFVYSLLLYSVYSLLLQLIQPLNTEAIMLKCDTWKRLLQLVNAQTGSIISITQNTPICNTLAQYPFISV